MERRTATNGVVYYFSPLLEARGVPHAFSTGIVAATSLHLLANLPMEQMIEWSMAGSPLNTSLTKPGMIMVDGYVDVPTTPGLGVELDWEVVERYRVG